VASKTNEQALESFIEKSLVGISHEELLNSVVYPDELYKRNNRFYAGEPKDFNKEYAIDEKRFWHFLEATQKEELDKLKRDPQYRLKILQRLDKMIKKYGIIKILKKGLDVEDAHFTLFYEAPLASSGETIKKRFASNEFSITRQVAYSLTNPNLEIDMVIFINGLPIITMELKNPWSGQNARFHGIKQYKEDRDPKEPLLNFARCIVHFAIDTDEVYMTTKLEGKKTIFLPFNKGNKYGAGNPVNPYGYKTAYMWEEIFTKVSLADMMKHPFICRETGSGTREVISEKLRSAGLARQSVSNTLELGSPESIKGAVEAGMGVSILSSVSVIKEVELGTLVAIPLTPKIQRDFSFVRQRNKFRAPAMEELLDFARSYCKAS